MAESQCLEDWHHADIIAALHKEILRSVGYQEPQGSQVPRYRMP